MSKESVYWGGHSTCSHFPIGVMSAIMGSTEGHEFHIAGRDHFWAGDPVLGRRVGAIHESEGDSKEDKMDRPALTGVIQLVAPKDTWLTGLQHTNNNAKCLLICEISGIMLRTCSIKTMHKE